MDNIDQNTINNIKNMVDNGDLNGAISQISPEMIQNFSKMFGNTDNSNNSNTQNPNSQIDMNQLMNLANSFKNQKNDPRSNLLNSLKPYLRDGKKEKLDNYINLINMSKVAEIMKNNPNMNQGNHK